jgi:hypothetical protein
VIPGFDTRTAGSQVLDKIDDPQSFAERNMRLQFFGGCADIAND